MPTVVEYRSMPRTYVSLHFTKEPINVSANMVHGSDTIALGVGSGECDITLYLKIDQLMQLSAMIDSCAKNHDPEYQEWLTEMARKEQADKDAIEAKIAGRVSDSQHS